ncbi:Oxygen-independent coproporphyrinogen-III oxidase-like protein [Polystyrenella longa]|uniref:Heme chaperone HemW n=1 Tax=Polystyrenella longa TaxID=2528007 RepID=A0A518CIJ4_9PLAN|nr:radical SAM family heme chaperone HemW [Polystyrenella longa]QDU79042.1 Oxygen-independent coproporphyrinogen-III oxidase-like protein [Polystyrenella longa]
MNEFTPTSLASPARLGKDVPRSAYIHVPFCVHRCGYCDFTLIAGRDQLMDDYLIALEKELERQVKTRREIDTLFLGGGTPSHLTLPVLEKLFSLLNEWFELAPGYEFSMEVNPAGLLVEKIDLFRAAGINRISLGLQSFDNEILKTLERDHNRNDIERVVEQLQDRFENISFDLIFGVPGESVALWKETLSRAVSLAPPHISTYGLTFEKGTDFWIRRERGELRQHTEEVEQEMYRMSMEYLPEQGYDQYEISNFAKPGFTCRHNQVYWNGASYFGLGPGAARYLDGVRTTNHRSVLTWLKRTLAGECGDGESEELNPEEKARELAVIQLRTTAGIPLKEFELRSSYDLLELSRSVIDKYHQAGWLEVTDEVVRLTPEGRFVADTLVVDFL